MKYMPVDMNIRFCQYLLAGARAAAKRAKVQVPDAPCESEPHVCLVELKLVHRAASAREAKSYIE